MENDGLYSVAHMECWGAGEGGDGGNALPEKL